MAAGALELNLIAEDTNQWGQDRRDGRNLSHLLAALGEIPGLRWIRILYAYPSYFTEDLIDEIANNPKARPPQRRPRCPPAPRRSPAQPPPAFRCSPARCA